MKYEKEEGRIWLWCSDCTEEAKKERRLCKDCYLKCPIPDEYRKVKEKK